MPPDSSQAAKAFAPPGSLSATTALGATRELKGFIDNYSKGQLNDARKNDFKRFISQIESLIVAEAAAPRAAGPHAGPSPGLPGTPPPPTDFTPRLQASLLSTQRAVESLREDLQDIVRASVQEALAAAPPAPAAAPMPAMFTAPPRAPRDTPRHLDVTIGVPHANRSEAFRKLTAAQLKNEVDAALDKSGIVGLVGTRVHGVRRLANGNSTLR